MYKVTYLVDRIVDCALETIRAIDGGTFRGRAAAQAIALDGANNMNNNQSFLHHHGADIVRFRVNRSY